MSFRETFRGIIKPRENGRKKLVMFSPAYFSDKLLKLPVGHKVWVTIDDKAPRRSDAQNRFYWLYLTAIENETGNSKEDLHEHFAQRYLSLPESILTIGTTEQRIVKRRSTTDLSKSEFSEYMMKIERDSGVAIPDAEEFIYGAKQEQIDVYNKVMSQYPEDENFQKPTI